MEQQLDLAAAGRYVADHAFRASPPGPVGVEAEFFVLADDDLSRVPSPAELRRAVDGPELPGRSRLTFEPGGQLELSAPPVAGANGAITLLTRDIAVVCARLAARGLRLHGGGMEAARVPRRQVGGGRYDAMAAHFAACSPASAQAGPVMMTATASIQLNLDAGRDETEIAARWHAAHALGPVLAATFACSPVLSGRAMGAASARLQAWGALDPCRTRPVPEAAPERSPREQWARYALAASVLLVRDADGGHRPERGFSLAQWLADPELGGRAAQIADVDYHLTTLFPPVRPRGFLELRYLDGQRLADWPVAVAVSTVLHDDPRARAAAVEASRPAAGRWGEAARCALADAPLGAAARDCLQLAGEALARMGVSAALQQAVGEFAARYTNRGRCPADDLGAGVPDLTPPSRQPASR